MKFKHTKIVATVGPASQNPEILKKMIESGVNVFRLNFSHGTHQSHLETIKHIKEIRRNYNKPIAILQDLTGPKIRLGKIENEPLQVSPGETLILDSEKKDSASQVKRIEVNYKRFHKDVFPGAKLLLSDGDLELKIEKIEGSSVYCTVIIGGNIYSRKGVNFPSGTFQVPTLTKKDEKDLLFGLENGVDLVAMSFVRKASDRDKVEPIFKKSGRSVPLVAKLEKHEAIENLDEIINGFDAIMVARGDLGVDIEPENVPFIQKKMINLANRMGKPVITATQMLRSMVESPVPTRAEVNDVANAILDGTDAVMLSEESAIGKYPVKAVGVMSKIAIKAEEYLNYYKESTIIETSDSSLIPESISHSATIVARDLKAPLIFAITRTGYTARAIARYRPKSCILALTPEEDVYHQLALVWGVYPVKNALQKDAAVLFDEALKIARKKKLLKKGDHYVFTSGYPLGEPGSINQVTAGKIS
ncbi:MAG: pyruvate kinase [Calditrichaeota bacterium]|nr:pyruvate kinase [Calditrichota bacterium]